MLTLVDPKTDRDKSAVPIVSIYSNVGKRKRRPLKTVYFTHDVNSVEKQNVAAAAGVLQMHRRSLKKLNKISGLEFDTICSMLDDGEEPEVGDSLRKAFWNVKNVFERALRREMFIGDDPKIRFELNFPKDKKTWPGTFTLIANSGAGKTYFLVDMIVRYFKSTQPFQRRTVIWLSPEWEIDKSLKPLKDRRWAFHVIGIDIGPIALKKSGLDAASYYHTKIAEPLENHGEDALICLDDFPDGAKALYPYLRDAYNTMLRTARHRGSGVISLQHTYAGRVNTTQALQSNKYVIFFPRSQQNRCIMFMRDHLMMQIPEAREMVLRFAALDRYMIIQLHSPVCIFNSKYLLLL
jgi:hypothetical protein